jgi:hypothetical protein
VRIFASSALLLRQCLETNFDKLVSTLSTPDVVSVAGDSNHLGVWRGAVTAGAFVIVTSLRGSHVLMEMMRLSFITFRLAVTSFFTNVTGTALPIGKLTMAFVVA